MDQKRWSQCVCAGCISSREKKIGNRENNLLHGPRKFYFNVWIASFATAAASVAAFSYTRISTIRFTANLQIWRSLHALPRGTCGQCPTANTVRSQFISSQCFFCEIFVFLLFFFFVLLVCFVHSTKLCRARSQCRRRRRRRHRIHIFSRFNCNRFRIVAGGFAALFCFLDFCAFHVIMI